MTSSWEKRKKRLNDIQTEWNANNENKIDSNAEPIVTKKWVTNSPTSTSTNKTTSTDSKNAIKTTTKKDTPKWYSDKHFGKSKNQFIQGQVDTANATLNYYKGDSPDKDRLKNLGKGFAKSYAGSMARGLYDMASAKGGGESHVDLSPNADKKDRVKNAETNDYKWTTVEHSNKMKQNAEQTHEKIDSAIEKLNESGEKDLEKAKEGLGSFGKSAIDFTNNMLGWGADAGIGLLTGGTALVPMAVRVFGSSTREAKKQGATDAQANRYGVVEAGKEVLSEMMFSPFKAFKKVNGAGLFDNFTEKGASFVANNVGKRLSKMPKNALYKATKGLFGVAEEGFEEVASSAFEPLAQTIYDKNATMQYKFDKSGFSKEEQEKYGGYYTSLIKDFGTGALMAGIIGGAGAIHGMTKGTTQYTDQEVKDVIKEAKNLGEQSSAYTFAETLELQQAQGQEVLPQQVDDLAKKVVLEAIEIEKADALAHQDARTQEIVKMQEIAGDMSYDEKVTPKTAIEAIFATEEMARRVSSTAQTIRESHPELLASGTVTEKEVETIARVANGSASAREMPTLNSTPQVKQLASEVLGEQLPLSNLDTIKRVQEINAQNKAVNMPDIIAKGKITARENTVQDFVKNFGNELDEQTVAEISDAIMNTEDLSDIPNIMQSAVAYLDAGMSGFVSMTDPNLDVIHAQHENTLSLSARSALFNSGKTIRARAEETRAKAEEETKKQAEKDSKKIRKSKKGGSLNISDSVREKAKREGKTSTINKLEALASMTGAEITVVESLTSKKDKKKKLIRNGEEKAGRIYIALDSQNPLMDVFKHELTHRLQETAPKEYGELKKYVFDTLYKGNAKLYNDAIKEKIKQYSEVDEDFTEADAEDELLADATDIFFTDAEAVNRLAKEHRTLAQKIHDIIASLLDLLRGEKKLRYQGQWLKDIDALEEAEKLWLKALDASKGMEVLEDSDLVDVIESGTVVSRASVSTLTERSELEQQLIDAGFDERMAKDWVSDIYSIASIILNDRDRLDYTSHDNHTALKPNNEYVFTLDFSTLCEKKRPFQGTFNAIQKLLPNTVITSDMMIEIRAKMDEKGYVVPCGACYVESRRRHLSKFANQWLEKVGDKYGELTLADVTTTDGLENLRFNNREAYDAFVKAMNAKGSANPKVVQLRTAYNGEILKITPSAYEKIKAIGGLRIQSFSDFELPHMIDMMQAVMDMATRKFMAQAYTKVPEFARVFGGTGIKINLSLIGKGTGLDARGNLLFDDKEGMPAKTAFELRDKYGEDVGTIIIGMNYEHILKAWADPRIDMVIPFHSSGWGKDEIEAMGMGAWEDFEDYQTEKVYGEYLDKNKKKKVGWHAPEGGDLDPMSFWDFDKSGTENAKRYLEICAEQGRRPVFYNFLVDNGDGTYSLQSDGTTDGYWKSLVDFKCYNNEGKGAPQKEVLPNFDMESAEEILNDYTGGADDLPVHQDVVDWAVERYKNFIYDEAEEERIKKERAKERKKREKEADKKREALYEANLKKTKGRASLSSTDSDGNKLSEGQQEFFKDSKAVDKNGNLLKLYHGTPSEFTIFNFSQGGKNGTAEGFGIYLSDSTEVAKQYGNLRMDVYANITKPAYSNKKTIKKTMLAKLIKATIEKEAESMLDDYSGNRNDALRDTWISNYTYTYDKPIQSSINEVAQNILDMNDNDMEIIQEVISGLGIRDYAQVEAFYDMLTETTGIDGFMTTWTDSQSPTGEPINIVLALRSNQVKNVDNENPTDDPDVRYSLTSVEPVQPTTDKWQRGWTFDEVKAKHPTLFELDADESEKRNPTQISGTVRTYRKIYDMLKAEGFNGTILDASSGLGYGTKAGIEEYGFNVEDIEPYPDKDYHPKYTDYSTLNKQYDFIISNAVLNVVPQDLRDDLIVKMGELLKPNGRMYINVRGKDVMTNKSNIVLDREHMEVFVESTGSYQKGFTHNELQAYVEDALGDDYDVEIRKDLSGISVMVYKQNQGTARFSISERQETKVDKLTEEVNRLKQEFKLSKGTLPKTEDLAKSLTYMMDKYMNHRDPKLHKQLMKELEQVYTEVAKQKGKDWSELDWDSVENVAYTVADKLLNNATALHDSNWDEYQNLKKALKGVTLKVVPAEYRAFGTYGHIKELAKGNVKISSNGTAIETVYKQLEKQFPEWFDSEYHEEELDMFYDIMSVLNEMEGQLVYHENASEAELENEIAGEVVELLFNTESRKTFADKQKDLRDKAVAKERQKADDRVWKQKARDKVDKEYALNQQKAKYEGKVQKLSEAKDAQKEKALNKQKESYEEKLWKQKARDKVSLEAQKKQYEERIDKIREARDANIQKEKDRRKAQRERAKERKQERLDRARLLKVMRRMNKMKTSNANRALIDELIGDLDLQSQGMTEKGRLKLATQLAQYEEIKASDPYFTTNKELENKLERLNNKFIKELTIDEVRDLTEALLELEQNIRTSKKLQSIDDRRETAEMVRDVVSDAREMDSRPDNKVFELGDKYMQWQLSGMRFFKKIANYNEDSPLYKIGVALNEGQRKMLRFQMESSKMFDEWTKKKDFIRPFSGNKAKKLTFKLDSGETINITPSMRASIYLHSLNEQNMKHIVGGGGLTIPDFDYYRKGDFGKALDKGNNYEFSRKDIARIIATIPENEMQFIRQAQKFFDGKSKEALNETCNLLYGYDKANVENYFPITTDSDFLSVATGMTLDQTIEGMGSMKERVNASNPIMLEDIVNVLNRSIESTGRFYGLAVPVRDYNKLINGVTWSVRNKKGVQRNPSEELWDGTIESLPDDTFLRWQDSVRKAIRQTWGSHAQKYLDNLLTDLQGGRKSDNLWIDKIRGNFAGGVLGVNISVTMKQLASIPTASAVLGGKAVAKGLFTPHKVNRALIDKYTPLLWYRSKGFRDQELGDVASRGSLASKMPALLGWIQWADMTAVGRLWYASEAYVKENYKDLKVGTDEYYQEVARWFDRTVEETQPNYTTMQRPDVLRTQNQIVKAMTMFSTQRMQNFNIVYEAVGNYKAKAKQYRKVKNDTNKTKLSEARKQLWRATSSQLIASGVIVAMTFIAKAGMNNLGDDDKEKEWWFKNFLQTVWGNLLFGGQMYEGYRAIAHGDRFYGFTDQSVELLNDLSTQSIAMIQSTGNLANFVMMAEGEDKDTQAPSVTKEMRKNVIEFAYTASELYGLPLENTKKLVWNAGIKRVMEKNNGKYVYMYMEESFNEAWQKSSYVKGAYGRIYKDAIKAGETAQAQEIARMMKEDGIEQKTIDNWKKTAEKELKENKK